MEEFKAQLGKMDQGIKGLGPFRMVEETINGFQQSLPLIQNLKSDSLRERHWLKLMELTGKTFDMNPRTFTLGSLFELNLDQYEDDIMTICGGALKELNIEVGINAIADTWRLQRFDVVKYFKGPQERGLVLKNTDRVQPQRWPLAKSGILVGDDLNCTRVGLPDERHASSTQPVDLLRR